MKMGRWTIQQWSQIAELCLRNNCSIISANPWLIGAISWRGMVVHKTCIAQAEYEHHEPRTILKLYSKMSCIVLKICKETFSRAPNCLDVYKTHYMRNEPMCHPYKIQIVQRLVPNDFELRLRFARHFFQMTTGFHCWCRTKHIYT